MSYISCYLTSENVKQCKSPGLKLSYPVISATQLDARKSMRLCFPSMRNREDYSAQSHGRGYARLMAQQKRGHLNHWNEIPAIAPYSSRDGLFCCQKRQRVFNPLAAFCRRSFCTDQRCGYTNRLPYVASTGFRFFSGEIGRPLRFCEWVS